MRDLRVMHSGRMVHLHQPDPAVVELDDIVRGLASTPRFAGQTYPLYTVAQHSLVLGMMVSILGHPDLVLPALLHDAAEAYLGDLHPALRSHEFDQLELEWLQAIYSALGVPWSSTRHSQVLLWDHRLLHSELEYFWPDGDWGEGLPGVDVLIQPTLYPGSNYLTYLEEHLPHEKS